MNFYLMMLLIAGGLYLIVFIISKMPLPIQQAVKDMLRFMFTGK